MDKREYILKVFEDFDTLIFRNYLKENNLLDKSDDYNLGVKAGMEDMYNSISHINYSLLRKITLSNDENNCFSFLYKLQRKEIFVFFGALMETHLFIEFRENFYDTNTLTKNEKESLLNKLNSFEDFIKEEQINGIISKINSDGNGVTERMVFENFLIKFCKVNKKNSTNNHPTQKAINNINKIIQYYFNSEIKFSRGQILKNENLTFNSVLGKIPVYLKNA